MNFKRTPPSKIGTERTVRKFLLLPRTYGNQTRWLEFANIRETFLEVPYADTPWTTAYKNKWVETGFAPIA